jgi:hypothetical protein
MKSYEIFKNVFARFPEGFSDLKLKKFSLHESKGLVSEGLVESYSAKYSSSSCEIEIRSTTLNIDCFVENLSTKKKIVLSDFLLNRNLEEIKRGNGEDDLAFFTRASNDIKKYFQAELAGTLDGSKWIDVQPNWRGYK